MSKKDDIIKIKKALAKNWSIQGFGAVPLFLNLAGYSGIDMTKKLGYGYSEFIYHYQKKYGEMYYSKGDLDKLWQTIKYRLAHDKNYLKKTAKRYDEIFKEHKRYFQTLNTSRIKKISDGELVKNFKKMAQAQIDSAGMAHIIEPASLGLESELKPELRKIVRDKSKFNEDYVILTAPTKLSFVAREENELLKIKGLGRWKKSNAIKKHARKYIWIQNNYEGQQDIGIDYFLNRIVELGQKYSTAEIKKKKRPLIKKLKIRGRILALIDLIDFCTAWQDDRKANILKSIYYLDLVAAEIARRLKLDKRLLYFMGMKDIFALKALGQIRELEEDLRDRSEECLFFMRGNQEIALGSKDTQRLFSRNKVRDLSATEIHGSVASAGTAMGEVKICKNISQISKVNKGDILVASMTRPEYMPAIKRAAAIITDEGGVTCHAAIIAREIGIPAIIGTKIATKVLRDGDLVEVRANHGLVKILQ